MTLIHSAFAVNRSSQFCLNVGNQVVLANKYFGLQATYDLAATNNPKAQTDLTLQKVVVASTTSRSTAYTINALRLAVLV